MSSQFPSEEDNRAQIHPKRFVFDGTLTIGDLLTSLGMLAIVFVQWSIMDKRVTLLEQQNQFQIERDRVQDQKVNDSVVRIEKTIEELKRTVIESNTSKSVGKGM